ncbi:unnamed protein product, partial [Laminaria digitata]
TPSREYQVVYSSFRRFNVNRNKRNEIPWISNLRARGTAPQESLCDRLPPREAWRLTRPSLGVRPWLKSLRGEVLCYHTRHGCYETRAEDRMLQQQHHHQIQQEQAAKR